MLQLLKDFVIHNMDYLFLILNFLTIIFMLLSIKLKFFENIADVLLAISFVSSIYGLLFYNWNVEFNKYILLITFNFFGFINAIKVKKYREKNLNEIG